MQALALLSQRVADPHLVIAGGDAGLGNRRRTDALAESLGVADRVHLLGRREDIADVLDAFDVACLSSDYEGMPLSIMEYMSAAKPIVSTRVGGVSEMVDDGVEGLLVPRRDPAAFADAVERLLRDSALAASLGRLRVCASDETSPSRASSLASKGSTTSSAGTGRPAPADESPWLAPLFATAKPEACDQQDQAAD